MLGFLKVTLGLLMALVQPGEEAQRFICLGPGGGGQMYGTGISPHDPNLMHVSCDMGTFYVSEDGGEHWWMCNQLEMEGITSTRPGYHPIDPNIVYMPYYRGVAQLRISRDRGRHWEVICDRVPWGKPEGRDKFEFGVTAIDFDPENPGLMFVSTAAGLYRSTDEGRTFTQCEQVLGMALGVHVSPASPRAARRCIAATSSGVFISEDGGVTWAEKGEGLDKDFWAFAAATDPRTGITSCYITSWDRVFASHDGGLTFQPTPLEPEQHTGCYRFLAMAQTDPATVYVSSFGSRYGVWKTTDGGKHWQQVFSRDNPGIAYGWIGRQLGTSWGGRANRITCDPRNPDLVTYVNTMEFFRSRDGGQTWTELCADYAGPDPENIDNAAPWSGVGLEVALPTDLVFDPFIKDRVYATYGDLCLMISDDRGQSWRRSAKGIPRQWINRMFRLIPDPANKGVLYAACAGTHSSTHDLTRIANKGGGVVMSTDHGETWTVISDGLDTSLPCTGLALDLNSPADNRTLYCVIQSRGVYRSTDGGRTWHLKSEGIGRADNPNVMQVKIGPDRAVYALVEGRSENWKFTFGPGGLWRSTDQGETWTEITQSVRLVYPKEFAIDPRNPQRILIATTQAAGGEAAGLWETTDGGTTWTQILSTRQTGKELYSYIHSGEVTFHPTDPNLIYYSTKTHGLWFSRDNGVSWQRLRGIPRLGTGAVTIDPDDPDLIYITSVGLWKGPATGF